MKKELNSISDVDKLFFRNILFCSKKKLSFLIISFSSYNKLYFIKITNVKLNKDTKYCYTKYWIKLQKIEILHCLIIFGSWY